MTSIVRTVQGVLSKALHTKAFYWYQFQTQSRVLTPQAPRVSPQPESILFSPPQDSSSSPAISFLESKEALVESPITTLAPFESFDRGACPLLGMTDETVYEDDESLGTVSLAPSAGSGAKVFHSTPGSALSALLHRPFKMPERFFSFGLFVSIAKIMGVIQEAHKQHIQCRCGIGENVVEEVLPVVRFSSLEMNHWRSLLPMLDAIIGYPTLTAGSVSLAPNRTASQVDFSSALPAGKPLNYTGNKVPMPETAPTV